MSSPMFLDDEVHDSEQCNARHESFKAHYHRTPGGQVKSGAGLKESRQHRKHYRACDNGYPKVGPRKCGLARAGKSELLEPLTLPKHAGHEKQSNNANHSPNCIERVHARGHTPNETKMSDGGRERASVGLKVWKSSQKWSVQRSAVRSIAWLGHWCGCIYGEIGEVPSGCSNPP